MVSGKSDSADEKRNRSRRTVLKAVGGTGLAATALAGLSSAATGDGFLCSVGIPTLFQKDETPLESENLIETTDTIYDNGVKIANRLVNGNLNTLRKAVRLRAYSSTAGDIDMIDPNDLPERAVVSGISAFEEPIEEQQERNAWGADAVPTLSGPTIVRRS